MIIYFYFDDAKTREALDCAQMLYLEIRESRYLIPEFRIKQTFNTLIYTEL